VKADPLPDLIAAGKCVPSLVQVSGNAEWAARVRFYPEGPAIHFLQTGLVAVPHPELKDAYGNPILKDFYSLGGSGQLVYTFDAGRLPFGTLYVKSPELGDESRMVHIEQVRKGRATLSIDLSGVHTYAVAQQNILKNV
jgi:hypothetical protein